MNSEKQFLISLNELRHRIKNACDRSLRSVDEVKLMAVTKTHPSVAVDLAVAAGLRYIGENRVQEAAGKRPQVRSGGGYWELIGPLQSNKARLAVETFDRIQTVDRLKLVTGLDRLCGELGKSAYPVLLQVNIGEDAAKSGCSADDAPALAEAILKAENLKLDGLMTIGEFSDKETVVRRTFSGLRKLKERLEANAGMSLPVLSMGMTHDLEWAIEEGSTLIRVGTALYGSR
jgi:pyridoxal phosphate enzyme (YggS family)